MLADFSTYSLHQQALNTRTSASTSSSSVLLPLVPIHQTCSRGCTADERVDAAAHLSARAQMEWSRLRNAIRHGVSSFFLYIYTGTYIPPIAATPHAVVQVSLSFISIRVRSRSSDVALELYSGEMPRAARALFRESI